MHSSVTPAPALPALDNHDIDKISAYYSLSFPNFTYYLQTLTVTIGRRPNPSSGSSSDASLVDVDLGPLKSVSRLHARIEYEEADERFVLVVLGRNGAWVDGIWAGSGSRLPLGARSTIQIATRTFEFILPPPPAPESTSLGSPPSTVRQRSPSVDITSLSPGSSRPPSPKSKVATISGATKTVKSSKKRKRPEPKLPLPENMPPKPLATYAVMCYRAIIALGGKASLQDVIQWMIHNYDWYRLNIGGPWENSVRHNLSSNRAFRNAAKSSEERGKGFLWSIDPQFESTLRDQDAKAQLAEQAQRENCTAPTQTASPTAESHPPQQSVFTREPRTKSTRGRKEKNPADLPPPLTRTPAHAVLTARAPTIRATASTSQQPPPAPPPALPGDVPTGNASKGTDTLTSTTKMPQIPPDVILPIVVGPLPDHQHSAASETAAALAASSSSTSAVLTAPPIVLHSGTLILNPMIFSHLTPPQLKELEGLGAQKALEILQSHIVRFLKESKRLERNKGRGRGRGRGNAANRGSAKGRPKGTNVVTSVEENHTEKAKQGSVELRDDTNASLTPDGCLPPSAMMVNGVELKPDREGPAAKKRRLDSTDDLNVNANADTEIDVVGT